MRHKDVKLCAVGALSFYLAFRFDMTKEFDEMDLDDWLSNETWFDIKLLVDPVRANTMRDLTTPMSNSTYSSAVKSVLGSLCIATNH